MIHEQIIDELMIVVIDRPARRNALTRAMVGQLIDAVSRFEGDPLARALILTGTGELAFCAGADVKEMAEDKATGKRFEPVMPALYEALLDTSKPTVAALNGDAVGGGLEIALACDVRIASRSSRLGLPEALSGMVPRFGAQAVARFSSLGVALEMAMSGALVSAERAAGVGLVNYVVEPDGVMDAAQAMARSLTSGWPEAVAAIKRLLIGGQPIPMRDLPTSAPELAMYDSNERNQGVAAFAVKRQSTQAPKPNER
jgi:enoyl-CoA hydratase